MIKKLARWTRSRAITQTLKDAKLYDAFRDLNKIVNLDPTAKAKNNAFEQAVKAAMNDQTVDMSIPQEIVDGLNPAAVPSELSFEQLSFVYNKHAELIQQANNDQAIRNQQETLYVGELAPIANEEITSSPDFDPKKAEKGNQTVATAGQKLSALLNSVHVYMENLNYTTLKLAQGKANSFLRKFIYDQLKGIGSYDNGNGEKGAMKERANLKRAITQLQKLNKRAKRIKGYAKEIINPPQFAQAQGLVNDRGELTKLQLMTSMLFYGTHTGRQRLENFNVNPDTFLEVADQVLTQDDMDMIQSVWDLYDTFKPKIKNMIEQIRGHDVEFVEGAAFEFKGKQYRGGYVPLRYRRKATIEQGIRESNQEMNVALGLEKEVPFDIESSEAFTKQGNLISRVKNYDGQLNLDWNYVVTAGFEDIIMQTTMHVPILNIMRLMKDKIVAKNMASVLGMDQFEEMKNTIIGSGRSHISQELELNSELANNFRFAISKPVINMIKGTLIGVPSTVVLQLSSGAYAWHSQGLSSTGRYIYTVSKLLLRPWLLPEAIRFAAELDPSIGTYVDNVTEDTRGSIGNVVAKDLYTGSPVIGRLDAKIVGALSAVDEVSTTIFLDGILGSIDMALKVPAVLTMYENFKNGKVKGFDKKKLAKMSPQDIEREARAYATRVSQSTLTATSNLEKSKAQKSEWLKGYSRFFNDVRNIYNYSMYNAVTKTRWQMNAAKKDFAAGNYGEATFKSFGTVWGLIEYQMYVTLAATIIAAAKGRGTDEDGEDEELDTMFTRGWDSQILQTALNNFMDPFLIPKTVVGGIPIIRDMVFSADLQETTDGRVRPIVGPFESAALMAQVDAYVALKSIWEYEGDFTDKELAAVLKGAATIFPVPYRALDQFMKSDSFGDKIQEISNQPSVLLAAPLIPVLIADALIDRLKSEGKQELVEQVEMIKEVIDPNDTSELKAYIEKTKIPINDYEKYQIMFAESAGDPQAYNKSTGAYGLYQFTRGTWKLMVDRYSSYGLTMNGWKTSTDQQEMAFRLLTREHAVAFTRADIPVNVESLYAAHHFGISTTLQILKKNDKQGLPVLLEERAANPWMNGKNPNINDGRYVATVGDFKQAIKDLLAIGQRKYANSINLD